MELQSVHVVHLPFIRSIEETGQGQHWERWWRWGGTRVCISFTHVTGDPWEAGTWIWAIATFAVNHKQPVVQQQGCTIAPCYEVKMEWTHQLWFEINRDDNSGRKVGIIALQKLRSTQSLHMSRLTVPRAREVPSSS